jgi:serine/threonine protein kinase
MASIEQPLDPQFFALQEALAGKYSLEAEIGRGGMGIVYLAQDVRLDRPVALKVLPQQFSSKAEGAHSGQVITPEHRSHLRRR